MYDGMRERTASRCAGAVLAMSAASMLVPRSLSEIPLSPANMRSDRPGREGTVTRPGTRLTGPEYLVHARVASRLPRLPQGDRQRVAATVLEEAKLAGLDPLLVLAIIEVESGYDPGARSERGAQGLMQLRPSTLGHEVARSHLSNDDPSDPALNVRAGVRYYGRLLSIFRRPDLALMAYNAGPNRISGYLRAGGVPERFRTYPRRVLAEHGRLRKVLEAMPDVALACSASGLALD